MTAEVQTKSNVGAAIGAIAGGKLSDAIGRRRALLDFVDLHSLVTVIFRAGVPARIGVFPLRDNAKKTPGRK